MADDLLERILRTAGNPDLVEVLAERLQPTDLQSLLLEVYRRSARKVTPQKLLEQYEQNRFVRPSELDPRKLLSFERLAWDLLPAAYVPMQLAPLCPLGTHSVVATVDQHKVIATIRNTEVIADPTNVLALEAALRRRRLRSQSGRRGEPVLLAASQRLTRAQFFEGVRSFGHFQLLGLIAAGRDTGSFEFESTRLLEHLQYYLTLLQQFVATGASSFVSFRVAVTEMADGLRTKALEGVLAELLKRFPTVPCDFDPARSSGRGYYENVCFKLWGTDTTGAEMDIGDGGMVDWTQKLISDRKERLLISALGAERLCL